MLLNGALLLVAILVALAIKMRWSYRSWVAALAGSLIAAFGVSYLLGSHHGSGEADAYAHNAAAKLSALPMPQDNQQLASLLASYRALDQFQESYALENVYVMRQMKALLNEPLPAHATVADTLRAEEARRKRARAQVNRSEEYELLQERALQTFLKVTVPPPSPDWPTELASSPPPAGFAYRDGGVWVGRKPNGALSYEAIQFPIEVSNGSDATLLSDQAMPILFYYPANRGRESERPRAAFTCMFVAVHRLSPGENKLFNCDFTSGLRRLEDQIQLVQQARNGALKAWVQPFYVLQYAKWDVPKAQPLIPAEIQRYVDLKTSDKDYGKQRENLRGALGFWLIAGGILFVGLLIPGLFKAVLPAGGVVALCVGCAVLSLISVPFAWSAGKNDGWAPLVYAILALGATGVFALGLLLANILIAKGAKKQEVESAGEKISED